MFRNRIARLGLADSGVLTSLPRSNAPPHSAAGMVLLPVAIAASSFQCQVYQLAYQRALADLAPPRHLTRYFSVWN